MVAAGIGLSIWTGHLAGTALFASAPFLVWIALHLLRDIGREKIEWSMVGASALALCTYVFVYSGILTSSPFDPLRISPRLAESSRLIAATLPDCPRLAPATVGYNEPSLVFLTGTDLLMTDGAGAARFVEGGPCRIAFVEGRQEAAFRAALMRGSQIILADRIEGLNLNGGRKLDIGVYARKSPAP
jgi:hypothetical protein